MQQLQRQKAVDETAILASVAKCEDRVVVFVVSLELVYFLLHRCYVSI